MAEPRFTVVGGGLAGLMTVIKLCEAGYDVDLFSFVPVPRSHSVCAQGGINGAVNTKGEGDSPGDPLRRHGLRRRLPRQPAAGQGDVRRGAGHHLPARPHGRAVQPHARGAARLPPLRRHAPPPHRVRRRHHRPAAPLRARRAGAPPRGRRARCASFERWEFVGIVHDDDGRCRGIVAQDLRVDEARDLPGRRGGARDRRPRHHLRQVDQLGDQHRHRRRRSPTSRARSTPTASSSRCTRPPSPAPTSCASSPSRCAARAAASGCRRRRATRATASDDPRERALVLPRGEVPRYGNLVPRDIASREIFTTCCHEGLGARRQDRRTRRGLPRRHAHPRTRRSLRRASSRASSRSTRSSSATIRARRRCRSSRPCTTRWAACGSTSSRRRPLGSPEPATNIPASSPSARSTTSTTAPTASAPTRSSPASTAAWSAGPAMVALRAELAKRARRRAPSTVFEAAKQAAGPSATTRIAQDGRRPRTRTSSGAELGELMTERRHHRAATTTSSRRSIAKIDELKERWKQLHRARHAAQHANQALSSCASCGTCCCSRASITMGALLRDESRGAHYKPEFLPEPTTKDPTEDPEWMKALEGASPDVGEDHPRPVDAAGPGDHLRGRSPRPCSSPSRAGTPEDGRRMDEPQVDDTESHGAEVQCRLPDQAQERAGAPGAGRSSTCPAEGRQRHLRPDGDPAQPGARVDGQDDHAGGLGRQPASRRSAAPARC